MKMITCHHCGGKGETKITPVFLEGGKEIEGTPVTIDCVFCEGTGKITEELKKAEEDFWCDCGNPSGETIYYGDGQGHLCDKHHYVCADCFKVVQVG